MPNPAFNRGGWFRIKQHRFNVENHPAISSDVETRKTSLRLPFNEKSAIDGLARMLSTSRSEAIRIALYEYPRVGAGSPKTPHRRTRCTHSVVYKIDPDSERTVKFLSEKWGISSSEVVRTCCSGLVKGIRRGDVTKLTNSKKRSQAELAREWSKKNKDRPKGSKLTSLMEAYEAGGDEWRDINQERRERREQFLREEPELAFACSDEFGRLDPIALDDVLDRREGSGFDLEWDRLLKIPDRDEAIEKLTMLLYVYDETDASKESFREVAAEAWDEASYKRGDADEYPDIDWGAVDLEEKMG